MFDFLFPKPRFQIIGWIGMVLILVAYFLVSFDIINVHNIWYQLLNVVGSAGIVMVAMNRHDWQPMVLNIVWILIAVFAIFRIIL